MWRLLWSLLSLDFLTWWMCVGSWLPSGIQAPFPLVTHPGALTGRVIVSLHWVQSWWCWVQGHPPSLSLAWVISAHHWVLYRVGGSRGKVHLIFAMYNLKIKDLRKRLRFTQKIWLDTMNFPVKSIWTAARGRASPVHRARGNAEGPTSHCWTCQKSL